VSCLRDYLDLPVEVIEDELFLTEGEIQREEIESRKRGHR